MMELTVQKQELAWSTWIIWIIWENVPADVYQSCTIQTFFKRVAVLDLLDNIYLSINLLFLTVLFSLILGRTEPVSFK